MVVNELSDILILQIFNKLPNPQATLDNPKNKGARTEKMKEDNLSPTISILTLCFNIPYIQRKKCQEIELMI